MPRRMSCSMTVDAVRDRTKTVTRRHVDTWLHLRPGDRLTLIEKGMGLAKGEKQVVLAEVEVVSVAVETLRQVNGVEVKREGLWYEAVAGSIGWEDYYDLDELPVVWFRAFWAAGHIGGTIDDWAIGERNPLLLGVPCRRIKWRYLEYS
jgi:hypothetical protein